MLCGTVHYLALSSADDIEQRVILDRLIFLHYVTDTVAYQLRLGNIALSRQPVQFAVEGRFQIKLHPVHALGFCMFGLYTPTLFHSDVYVIILRGRWEEFYWDPDGMIVCETIAESFVDYLVAKDLTVSKVTPAVMSEYLQWRGRCSGKPPVSIYFSLLEVFLRLLVKEGMIVGTMEEIVERARRNKEEEPD